MREVVQEGEEEDDKNSVDKREGGRDGRKGETGRGKEFSSSSPLREYTHT